MRGKGTGSHRWSSLRALQRTSAIGLRVALVVLLSTAAAGAKEFKGKRVVLEHPPHSQLRDRPGTSPVGKFFMVGRSKLKARVKDGKLLIGRTPGAGAIVNVKEGKAVTVRVGGKPRQVTFVLDAQHAWHCYQPLAWDYEFGSARIRLVDLDCDGKFSMAGDGYLAYESRVACPLEKVLLCGTERIEIRSISRDGSKIKATVTGLEGTETQLAALVDLNRRRAGHGISPVALDEAVSRACTAHAEYLAVNNWTGRTNPHSQTLGPKGASKEGEGAAARSVITSEGPMRAIGGFWLTYYHRGPLIFAQLRRVGINANSDFAVVDVRSGVERDVAGPWRDEVFVPADGSVGHGTKARSEMPKDPVPAMETRGNPIQLHIRDGAKVTAFHGSLATVDKNEDVPVFVVQRSGTLFGLVPKAPLSPETWYRVTISYEKRGHKTSRVIRFRTE